MGLDSVVVVRDSATHALLKLRATQLFVYHVPERYYHFDVRVFKLFDKMPFGTVSNFCSRRISVDWAAFTRLRRSASYKISFANRESIFSSVEGSECPFDGGVHFPTSRADEGHTGSHLLETWCDSNKYHARSTSGSDFRSSCDIYYILCWLVVTRVACA